jgi:hypothetical protein
MDDNTFKAVLAVIACIQVVALAYFARKQGQAVEKIATVHELVNGLAHEKDSAVAEAARKQGELAGRDWARRNPPGGGNDEPAF